MCSGSPIARAASWMCADCACASAPGRVGLTRTAIDVRRWHELPQQSHALCGELAADVGEAGDVAAGMVEARNQSDLHRVGTGLEHNWNPCGGRFGCQCDCRAAAGCDHRDRAADQLGGESRQSVQLTFCPAIFDRDISAFDIAGVGQTLTKGVHLQFKISH